MWMISRCMVLITGLPSRRHFARCLTSSEITHFISNRANAFSSSRKSISWGLWCRGKGLAMQSSKVEAIRNWEEPTSVKGVQRFSGFANFYRRFIPQFAKVTKPLTDLTKKGQDFRWTLEGSRAFEDLKALFTTEPVLRHFASDRPIYLETDASDFAVAGVASQYFDTNGEQLLHPVGYFSKRMNPAERNYDVHDKELLAIMLCLNQWHYQILDNDHPLEVITDHRNLETFQLKKQLNRRQMRWQERIVWYTLRIRYRPGKQGGKADALMRRDDYHPGRGASLMQGQEPANFSVLLPAEMFGGDLTEEEVNVRWVMGGETLTDKLRDGLRTCGSSFPLWRRAMWPTITAPEYSRAANVDVAWTAEGLLLWKGRYVVPDYNDARLQVLENRHDSPVAGHPGENKTLELVSRDYFWPGLRQDVQGFVKTCHACARNKARRHAPYGTLKTLELPSRPWEDLSMDLIEGLPLAHSRDSILVIVDRFSKMALFIPTDRKLTAKTLADLYLTHVFSKWGKPKSIVSDRGSEFTSKFWKEFTTLLDIKSRFSTAYHPQTDGQTERVNQELERYLRHYTSYLQDDWDTWLPVAEFAYNNSVHSATGITPFFACLGYHPSFDVCDPGSATDSPAGRQRVADMAELWSVVREALQDAAERAAKHTDARRILPPPLAVGDGVLVRSKNIMTKRPSKKLDCKYYGPFPIIGRIGTHAFRLRLPPVLRIHDVFHIDTLEPAPPKSDIKNRREDPPGPVESADGAYEVEKVLDSEYRGKMRTDGTRKVWYCVKWLGYEGEADETTWEPEESVAGATARVKEFHRRYPTKPRGRGL